MHHYIAELFDVLSSRRRFPFHMAVAAYNRMLLLPLFGMHWSDGDDGGGEPRCIGKYILWLSTSTKFYRCFSLI